MRATPFARKGGVIMNLLLQCSFFSKEFYFHLQLFPAGLTKVSSKTIFGDDAMAGNRNRERVSPAGLADDTRMRVELFGEFAVRECFAGRDF